VGAICHVIQSDGTVTGGNIDVWMFGVETCCIVLVAVSDCTGQVFVRDGRGRSFGHAVKQCLAGWTVVPVACNCTRHMYTDRLWTRVNIPVSKFVTACI